MTLVLPKNPRGRPTKVTSATFDGELQQFCNLILEINSRLGFRPGVRGWCYLLEEHGLSKGDFDTCEKLISDCRKKRLLPMNICAKDAARSWDGLEDLDDNHPEEFADWIVGSIKYRHSYYTPFSFWDDKSVFIMMLVEKIDLKTLFAPICNEFYIPIANGRGWSDLHARQDIIDLILDRAQAGIRCIILYCGDHDPPGLNISDTLRKNIADLLTPTEWLSIMDNIVIDRFGLNHDFIQENNLSWTENLITGSGEDLSSPRHKFHKASWVQDYISRYGRRKVEANALVVRPDAGRELCRQTILKYLSADAPREYQERLMPHREAARQAILQAMQEM